MAHVDPPANSSDGVASASQPVASNADAFVVAWNPVPTASRVAAASRALRMSLISATLFPAIAVVVWLASGRSDRTLLTLVLTSLAISALIAGYRIVQLTRARQALARVPRGEALRVDRAGLTMFEPTSSGPKSTAGNQPQFVPWHTVTAVAAQGKSSGAGPDLVITYAGGVWRAPLSFLDALPGTIDSALRAYSGARVGLDLSGLDGIW